MKTLFFLILNNILLILNVYLLFFFVEKSLADQIADLDNTAPIDYDPEDLVEPMNETTIDEDDRSDTEQHDARSHYVKVGKSSLRNQQAFLMDDPRYSGERKSRKDIYSDSDTDEQHDMEQETEDDSEDNSDQEGSWQGIDDNQDVLGLDDNEEEEEEEEVSEADDGSDDDDDQENDNELSEQLRQLQNDEKDMLSQLAKNTSSDIEKGQHVRQQLTLWDNCLETRIRIQKAVELANQLPQIDKLSDIVEKDDNIKQDVNKVKGELRDVIDELMDLRTALLGENEAIDLDGVSYNTRKRYLDDEEGDSYNDALWNDINQVNNVFVPFRNSTLEKWSNKVQAASNGGMNKKFKAFDQNILTQIDNLMSDKQGLVKRTQLQRAEYKILGKVASTPITTNDDQMENQKKSDRYLDTYDEELFDDNDFYQQQLRELIESRMVDTDDPIASGMRWAASKKDQVKKKKKNIDTKGSKGRKLR
ncbi:apoptosis antagonizing transcription factor-domain-containing protein [Halteromyces radiatus]|uniref:apoptosis antagonizing transcription factor-domain-containing protein n=1 Tax=Halteromyces radiatus TaxID=101107 RepID=UPI00221F3A3F|nr:apoptosis antagonizing transcription factor-domain-containing protein [Halteromyces radiatus]KAI8097241.1 apoptosis antagonizing transcription factor-domain-containing protein [Halteromyces radiatus]